jgi:serine/threonine protein phosphatase PrpC
VGLSFKAIALSDRGLIRDGNEDSALISPTLIAVADGMGGHAAGEVASKLAVTTLLQHHAAPLLTIAAEINNEIASQQEVDSKLSGMGTTLTSLSVRDNEVELLHIGDSRCYKFSKGKLTQVSYDHTVMQELIDQGRLSPDEVSSHPQRSLLTQALMGKEGIAPVVVAIPAKKGDTYLLCSDGLSSVLSESEIAAIAKKHDFAEIPAQLVSATKAKGAPDNVTVIWAEIVDGENEYLQLLGAAHE